MVLNDLEKQTLFIGAFRYYLGRCTYAVSDFTSLVEKHWLDLDKNTKRVVQKELDKELKQDQLDREQGEQFCRLGHDCDRKSWENLYEFILKS